MLHMSNAWIVLLAAAPMLQAGTLPVPVIAEVERMLHETNSELTWILDGVESVSQVETALRNVDRRRERVGEFRGAHGDHSLLKPAWDYLRSIEGGLAAQYALVYRASRVRWGMTAEVWDVHGAWTRVLSLAWFERYQQMCLAERRMDRVMRDAGLVFRMACDEARYAQEQMRMAARRMSDIGMFREFLQLVGPRY
jgi:hypothetical protein